MPTSPSKPDESTEATHLVPRSKRSRARMSLRQWGLVAVSAVASLTMLIWAVQVAMTNLDAPTPIDAKNVSRLPQYAHGSSPDEIATLRAQAKQIDAELLDNRRRRLASEASRPRPDGDDVYDGHRRKVQNLENLIKGKKLVPGTVAFDMNERLKELKADAPLSYEERRALRDQ